VSTLWLVLRRAMSGEAVGVQAVGGMKAVDVHSLCGHTLDLGREAVGGHQGTGKGSFKTRRNQYIV
jgi:hypothetical protein